MIDVGGTGAIVAEGVVASTDPNEKVHFVQLGKDAIKVWVMNATVPEAVLWRPTSDLVCIEDAVGSTVAWPAAKVVTESSSSKYKLFLL